MATVSNPEWPFLTSKYCAVENQSCVMFRPGDRFHRITRRSASRYGSGRSSRAWMTLNIAVCAPIPSVSDRIAVAANAGDFSRLLHAKRTSLTMPVRTIAIRSRLAKLPEEAREVDLAPRLGDAAAVHSIDHDRREFH